MHDRADNPGTLRELLAYIEATKLTAGTSLSADGGEPIPCTPASPAAMLNEFQQLWGRVRTEGQLRQSLAAVPEDAGPLHSSTLLHRAMTLMQDVAPGYLQHFVAYADALSWMEQLQQAGGLEPPTPTHSVRAKATGKPRVRKRTTPQ